MVQLGVLTGSTRTDEQTQIALFWRASPTALWNPLLRRAIESRGLNLSDTARVAALFYLAAADASVACWEAKYFYNFWRPEPAPGFTIEATSPQNVGFVRYWQAFSEGLQEVIDARIYSGIHFRTADEAGARLGRQVAKFCDDARPATSQGEVGIVKCRRRDLSLR